MAHPQRGTEAARGTTTMVKACKPADVSDRGAMREAFGKFATGITVLTAGGDHPHGMTANAFSSVSLDPPLVLVCVDRNALMHDAITATETYAVSVLHGEQEDLARHFADKNRPPGWEQFESVEWLPGDHTGAPLLGGSLAWVECELSTVYDGGDHSIFIGKVLSIAGSGEQDALLYFGGCYHRLIGE
jgi:flavin reductase (DIM6/NTAB) family NADH-FMN oxidoreductase RutF